MEEASSNRAGDKGSESYTKNADDVSELVPFSGASLNQNEDETVTEKDTNCEVQHSIRPNDSYPILHVTVPSAPCSRSSSPHQERHLGIISEESKVESGKLDNVSVALSEYNFSDSQKSWASYNSTLPRRNMTDAATEMSDRTKSTTPVSYVDAKDEEEQILEVLRMVVRKCATPEPSKRPTSDEVLSILVSSLK